MAASGDGGLSTSSAPRSKRKAPRLLPNTAGCTTAREAIQLAHMARELYATPTGSKLEVVGDEPHAAAPIRWSWSKPRRLNKDRFTVFPYCDSW